MAVAEPTTEQRLITGEEFAAMADIGPTELVAGKIRAMMPNTDEHGVYAGNVYASLRTFVVSSP